MGRPSLPQTGATHVISGARAIALFNDFAIGYATGVNITEEIMYEPVETLDNLAVREHCPVGYRVTLSCTVFRTVAQAASTDSDPGSLKQQNIFPRFTDILRVQGLTFAVQDRITNKTIQFLKDVKAASQDFRVTARGIVGQNVTFVTTRVLDESENLP